MIELAEFKVLQPFKDIETGERYETGQVIKMTVKRANEAIKNLSKYDGEFLERIDNKKEEEQLKTPEDKEQEGDE